MKKLFIPLALGGILFAIPVPAEAQQPTKTPRIGFLTNASFSANPTSQDQEALRRSLRELGKNIVIEWRSGEENRDRQLALGVELARLKVDVIVAVGSGDIRAAKAATTTIPIVMVLGGDAVGSGFVGSLARPGGNITGLSTLRPDLSGKRFGAFEGDRAQALPRGRLHEFTRPRLRASVERTRACRQSVRSEASAHGYN